MLFNEEHALNAYVPTLVMVGPNVIDSAYWTLGICVVAVAADPDIVPDMLPPQLEYPLSVVYDTNVLTLVISPIFVAIWEVVTVPETPQALIAFAMSWNMAGRFDAGKDAADMSFRLLMALPMLTGDIGSEVPPLVRIALAMPVNTEFKVTTSLADFAALFLVVFVFLFIVCVFTISVQHW